jgi:hypothetical protein
MRGLEPPAAAAALKRVPHLCQHSCRLLSSHDADACVGPHVHEGGAVRTPTHACQQQQSEQQRLPQLRQQPGLSACSTLNPNMPCLGMVRQQSQYSCNVKRRLTSLCLLTSNSAGHLIRAYIRRHRVVPCRPDNVCSQHQVNVQAMCSQLSSRAPAHRSCQLQTSRQ